MTDTIEHGRLQAAESLAADIARFDFGTNTGRALELAQVKNQRELIEEFPDIAKNVFPTDPRTGEILPLEDINIALALNRTVEEVNPLAIRTATFESAVVDERENVLEDPWFRQGYFVVEETMTPVKPTITTGLTNKQKAGGLGILGALLFF